MGKLLRVNLTPTWEFTVPLFGEFMIRATQTFKARVLRLEQRPLPRAVAAARWARVSWPRP
jgi:hypothetical protein